MILKEQLKDATLLTGLLTALQALTVEITETKLEELELQQFQIFLLSSSKFSIAWTDKLRKSKSEACTICDQAVERHL